LAERPGLSIPDFDFDKRKKELTDKYGSEFIINDSDVISSSLYKEVF